jgi:hypothetical protein
MKDFPCYGSVHDEFAEWMLVDDYKSAVSSAVQRLGVKARAAGIHLILQHDALMQMFCQFNCEIIWVTV